MMKLTNLPKLVFLFFGLMLAAGFLGGMLLLNETNFFRNNPGALTEDASQTGAPSAWENLLLSTPVAYQTALPVDDPTPLDGTYARLVESEPQYWLCLRCADYRPAGGIWKLQFERGVMRIYYDVTGWHSLASYTVDGDRLIIYNDPYCPDEAGNYQWHLQDGTFRLSAISDTCSFSLRAENLSLAEWELCPAGVKSGQDTSGSKIPVGCVSSPSPALLSPPSNLKVEVLPGDSRFFEDPPDVFVIANKDDVSPPAGIQLDHHPGSVSYGLNRVLWWRGNWIEARTDLPFSSMGVQFLGTPAIGWARVLFDGVEVWRGDTAAIWSKYGRHGGYIEVSGFKLGEHTLRVESLDFDYRPVTVASFGFR